jgi:hypothetical protein
MERSLTIQNNLPFNFFQLCSFSILKEVMNLTISEQIDQLFDSNQMIVSNKTPSTTKIKCEIMRTYSGIFDEDSLINEFSYQTQVNFQRFGVQYIPHGNNGGNPSRFHVQYISNSNSQNYYHRFKVQHIPHSNNEKNSNCFDTQSASNSDPRNSSHRFKVQHIPHSNNEKISSCFYIQSASNSDPPNSSHRFKVQHISHSNNEKISSRFQVQHIPHVNLSDSS